MPSVDCLAGTTPLTALTGLLGGGNALSLDSVKLLIARKGTKKEVQDHDAHEWGSSS